MPVMVGRVTYSQPASSMNVSHRPFAITRGFLSSCSMSNPRLVPDSISVIGDDVDGALLHLRVGEQLLHDGSGRHHRDREIPRVDATLDRGVHDRGRQRVDLFGI